MSSTAGSERPRRRPASAAIVVVAMLCASPAAAGAAPFATWSAPMGATADAGSGVTNRTTGEGRHWFVELPLRHAAILRSRSLRNGRIRTLRVAVPRVPGAVSVVDEFDGDQPAAPAPQLFVAGGQGFVSGTWCTRIDPDSDDDSCAATRSFYARFDLRTGRVLDRRLSARPRTLVGGDRVTELVPRPDRSSLLKDAITRRTVLVVPRTARDLQGAGTLVTWKSGGSDATGWERVRFVRRTTGRAIRTLDQRDLRRAAGGSAYGQSVTVQPSGAIDLDLDVAAGGFAVYVDESGRPHRFGPRLPHVHNLETRALGDRVLLFAGGDNARPMRCDTINTWVTDRTGTRGYELRHLPVTPGYGAELPAFADARTILWTENDAIGGGRKDPRIRAGHDVRALPLTPEAAPRC